MFSLAGRIAVVTGPAGGLELAIARALLARAARTLLVRWGEPEDLAGAVIAHFAASASNNFAIEDFAF